VLEAVRSDIARGKALDFLIEHAAVVDAEGNPIDLTLPERTTEATDPADTGDSPDSVPEEQQA
jgi:hypothetical protein